MRAPCGARAFSLAAACVQTLVSPVMNLFRVIPALFVVVLVAGCSSTSRMTPPSGDEVRTLGQDGASAAESIAAADLLYREALAHYVTDALDEARHDPAPAGSQHRSRLPWRSVCDRT